MLVLETDFKADSQVVHVVQAGPRFAARLRGFRLPQIQAARLPFLRTPPELGSLRQ